MASTLVAAVIGDPIAHSLSPLVHNAAFAATGLDWTFVAFRIPSGGGAAAVSAARSLGISAMSVTMPLKAEVVAGLDRLTPVAERLGAVNCIFRQGTDLVGDNTDGEGFVASIRTDPGFDPTDRRCVVLGAGGAARAVVLALAQAGAARVTVVNRNRGRGEAAASLAGDAGAVGEVADITAADLVVNATSLGMNPGDALPCDVDVIGPAAVVVDLVYHPLETPWLASARLGGRAGANGVGMLIGQAAVAFERWTGLPAPLDAMAESVRRHLAG